MDPSPTDAAPDEALCTFDRWYAAHETGDLAALADVLAEDATVRSMFRSAPVCGRADAVTHFSQTMRAFPDLAMPLVSGPAATTTGAVLAECRFVGTFGGRLSWAGADHVGSGQPFDVSGVILLHTGGGQVHQVRTLFDRDDWLGQIGVSAQSGVERARR